MKTKHNLIQICLLGAALMAAFTGKAQPIVTKIAAGQNDILYLMSDGSFWGAGANFYGELGDGTTSQRYPPEVIVDSGGGVTAISEGTFHTLFIRGGNLWAMGYNLYGQLGDGTLRSTNRPEQIMLTQGSVAAVAAGSDHSLFIKNSGSGLNQLTELWSMGQNNAGQLGDGMYTDRYSPVELLAENRFTSAFVTAIAAGGGHSLFIKNDGSLWAMGANDRGQLGDGTTDGGNYKTNAPERILPSGVTTISAGGAHSLFIKSDGSLWAMGDNTYGQLGDGTADGGFLMDAFPEQIVPSGVTAIAAGFHHSLFLKSNGSLWGMGENDHGELGNGTSSNAISPVEILPGGVTAIAAGNEFSVFAKSDGTLWGMGDSAGWGVTNVNSSIYLPVQLITTPPPVAITTWLNQPVVVYGTVGTNYVLQTTTNLASPNWVPFTNGVAGIAVIITNAPSNAFFRLR